MPLSRVLMHSFDDVPVRGLLPVPGEVHPVKVFSPFLCELSGGVEGELESHVRRKSHEVVLVV